MVYCCAADSPDCGGEKASGPPPRRILIVEDDHVTQTLYNKLLTHQGHVVHIAASARSARLHLETQTYDLILLDAWLPDSHGAEVIKSVRGNPRHAHVPIIVISSDDSPENMRMMKE